MCGGKKWCNKIWIKKLVLNKWGRVFVLVRGLGHWVVGNYVVEAQVLGVSIFEFKFV